MVKPTFINLPDEKKKRLIDAAKKEFSRTTYNDASINKIIKDAEISRGSFYTYFDNKADLARCLLYEYAKAMTDQITSCLEKNDGDIFTLFSELFESTIEYTELKDDMALFHSLFKTMQTSGDFENQMIFNPEEKNKHEELIINKVNKSLLNIQADSELKELVDLLFMITKQSIAKALSEEFTKEQARKSFLYKMEILKNGILRQN